MTMAKDIDEHLDGRHAQDKVRGKNHGDFLPSRSTC